MATVARFIGWCPVCQKSWKVRTNVLVHHGFQRPGTGSIHGDCFGVGMPPHETSPVIAETYLSQVVAPEVRRVEARLAQLGPPGEPDALPFDHWDSEARQYTKVIKRRNEVSDYDWKRRLGGIRSAVAQELEYWRGEVKRLEGLISAWTKQPLITIDEQERRERESKSHQQARVTSDREQKSEHAFVNLQQQIDRAVKKKDTFAVTDLFIYGWQRVLEPLGVNTTLRREDILRRLDRDDVWYALGFIRDGEYIGRSEANNTNSQREIDWPAPKQVSRATLDKVKSERAAKQAAKIQKEFENVAAQYQKHIDQALASRSAASLLRTFLHIDMMRSHEQFYKIDKAEGRDRMLRYLERDDLWATFGWIHPDGGYFTEQDFEAVMGPRWKWYNNDEVVDATYPWPWS